MENRYYSTAAPATIAANATVIDWNDSTKAPTTELRKGTNGWTCLPLNPPPAGGYTSAAEAAPMCGDAMAMMWGQAWMTKTKPKNTTLGIAYMLHGDLGVSNNDPYGMAATADNDFVASGPHVMVLPADPNRIRTSPRITRQVGRFQNVERDALCTHHGPGRRNDAALALKPRISSRAGSLTRAASLFPDLA